MTRLAVVLTEGFADWEVGQLAASARTHFGFDVVTASPGGAGVRSMGGMRVAPDTVAENLHGDAFDALVICGGTIWETERAPDLSPVINDFIAEARSLPRSAAARWRWRALVRSMTLPTPATRPISLPAPMAIAARRIIVTVRRRCDQA